MAERLELQSRICTRMGSPLYTHLLRRAAEDCRTGGIVWSVLSPHDPGPRPDPTGLGGALPLRFVAAVHRLVLEGQAPRLALHYPSAGGEPTGGVWEAFVETLAAQRERVSELVGRPCQTNEVGRAAALVGGFLEVAANTGLPLRLLEVGASAGLNLRWDAFRYGGGGASWGDPASPVDLDGLWTVPPTRTDTRVEVAERSGCDPNPVDPGTVEGRLTLTAAVWADQTERLARLRGAIELARRIPATVDTALVDDWLPDRLGVVTHGAATVVYHSVLQEYVSPRAWSTVVDSLHGAGVAATASAPLAWLRLEPSTVLRTHALTLTLWPGGQERTLARSGAHGGGVVWEG